MSNRRSKDYREDDRRRRSYRSRSRSPRDRSRSRSPRHRRRDSRDFDRRDRYDDDRRDDRKYERREEGRRADYHKERIPAVRREEPKKGLNIEIHPLLTQSASVVSTGSVSFIPKASTSTTLANQRAAERLIPRIVRRKDLKEDPVSAFLSIKPETKANNPYFDPRISTGPKHTVRPVHFHQKGTFIAKATQMRREAQMEVLKREIAESTLSAGLDVDIVSDLLTGSAEMMPKVEWWDLPFLSEGQYKLESANLGIINTLIQRPALIQPPVDLDTLVAPKPLALTKEELKKMRRQRRLQEQKDKQEKIRLGLLPPEEPKIKLANLMKVLANESVQEPSRIEAEVRSQAEARHQAHLKANENRKLEAEQAHRTASKPDLPPLIQVAVYKINRVERNQWKFKIKRNAIQDNLTGCAILSPKTNIIVVEGASKGQKHYKALLTRRIDWNEAVENDGSDMEVEPTPNQCTLLWEGTVAKPSWKFFEFKEVPADIDVKEYFMKLGLENYWNLAKTS